MFRKFLSVLGISVLVVSCHTTQTLTTVQYRDYQIENQSKKDTGLINLLAPYASRLNSSMNTVIGFASRPMTAKQPESGLGNFMADAMLQMAEEKYGIKIDGAFMNQGGIRSYIPQGNITIGKIFELMPFDNLVVIQKIKGSVLQQFLDKTAADGGWPVSSGIRLHIKNKKAIDITIQGKPLEPEYIYTIANSDYVANGGSDCAMLRGIPQISKGYLFRDALLEFVTEMTKQGKPVDFSIENRVVNVN
ncbi:MAG: 5'-nucleotidase C-terminal domain-containing protein [Bacteroidota bacterium]|nr:5'-nucleotidase C-terminal domain-containing protein [Bacteroidota bacterium]